MIQYIIVPVNGRLVKRKMRKNGEKNLRVFPAENAPKEGETPRTLSRKADIKQSPGKIPGLLKMKSIPNPAEKEYHNEPLTE